MTSLEYYLLWLFAGLIAAAIASGLITHRARRSVMRRLKAVELLDALSRYSEWVAVQRRNLLFQGEVQDEASSLAEVSLIVRQWFPDLAAPAAQVLAVHARLVEFLSAQQALRFEDPESWLESDHDVRLLEQWRVLDLAVERMAQQLKLLFEPAAAQPGPRGAPAA